MSDSKQKSVQKQQEIVTQFQKMRESQRNMANKIAELELDLREHE